MNNWISVKDRLPDYDVQVLWIREDSFKFIDDIDHDNDWYNFKKIWENDDIMNVSAFGITGLKEVIKITHWQPLPDPPNG